MKNSVNIERKRKITPVHQFMCGAHSRHLTTQYNYFWHKYGFINIFPAFWAPSRSRKRIHVYGVQAKPRCKLTDGFVNEEARGLLCKKKLAAQVVGKTKVAQEKTTRARKNVEICNLPVYWTTVTPLPYSPSCKPNRTPLLSPDRRFSSS